jgi:hypothetical protein
MTDEAQKLAYRFEDFRISHGFNLDGDPYPGSSLGIQCMQYPIIRFTPKGMWINVWSGPRFVLLTANKRFADPCKETAWLDFQKRKSRQAFIYSKRVDHAEEALRASKMPLSEAVSAFNMNNGLFDAH